MFYKNLQEPIELDLVGNIIVSTSYNEKEACFQKSVILILSHDKEGSLGVIVNKQIKGLSPEFIYTALEVNAYNDIISTKKIMFGGPSENEKGLVIHSSEYDKQTLLHIKNKVKISSNIDLLQDIANYNGPKFYQIIIGYTEWKMNQLEQEIKNGEWIVMPYSHELVFGENHDSKWNMANNRMGINPSCFISTFGNA